MSNLPQVYMPEPRGRSASMPAAFGASGLHTDLPGDLYAEYVTLRDAMQRTEELKREADGMFGPIGADGLVGLIPGVGALYTLSVVLRLQSCAAAARCGFGIRLTGWLLGLADIAVGIVIGPGDLLDFLFRSGAIFANAIQRDIRRKLLLIEAGGIQIDRSGYLTDADVTRLRDTVRRNGQTEGESWLRKVLGFGFLLFLLYSCAGS